MSGFDHGAVAHNHSSLQGVAQLAHIAGPRVVMKKIQDSFADDCDFTSMLCAHFTQKTLHQLRYVLLVVAQWRHMNVEHIQPIIEVVAKLTPGHCLLWHLIGCG